MRSGSKALMRSAAALAAALFLNAQAHAASILREATIGEPPPLDVMLTTADVAAVIGRHIFETLYALDSNYNPRPALADSELHDAVMAAHHRARQINDLAGIVGFGPELAHHRGIVAVGHEADVLAVRLLGDRQVEALGERPGLALGHGTEREAQKVELLRRGAEGALGPHGARGRRGRRGADRGAGGMTVAASTRTSTGTLTQQTGQGAVQDTVRGSADDRASRSPPPTSGTSLFRNQYET